MIILVVIAYSLLFIFEFFPLYNQKQWRDLWLTMILGLCSFTLIALLSFGVKIPSPAMPIKNVILSIFGK
ncbi:MAG: hypothetical protein Q8934_05875 [Bacillota bacterium]|nr:hypothetical protein [Bacillota bacterium]